MRKDVHKQAGWKEAENDRSVDYLNNVCKSHVALGYSASDTNVSLKSCSITHDQLIWLQNGPTEMIQHQKSL